MLIPVVICGGRGLPLPLAMGIVGSDIDIGACRSAINVDRKPFILSSSTDLAFSGDLDFCRLTGEAFCFAVVDLGEDGGGGIGGEGGREVVGDGGRTSEPVRPCRLDSPY